MATIEARVLRDRVKSLESELRSLKAARANKDVVPLPKYEQLEKLAAERFALLDALERQNRDLIAKLAAAKAQIEDLEKIRPVSTQEPAFNLVDSVKAAEKKEA